MHSCCPLAKLRVVRSTFSFVHVWVFNLCYFQSTRQSPPLLFYTSAATFKARPDEFGVVTPHSDDDVQMTDCGPQPSEKKVRSVYRNDYSSSTYTFLQSVIISSEPLNHEKEKWHMVPKNHLICVNERADICTTRYHPNNLYTDWSLFLAVVRIAVPMKRYRNAVRKWLARARGTIAAKRQVMKPDIWTFWRSNTLQSMDVCSWVLFILKIKNKKKCFI